MRRLVICLGVFLVAVQPVMAQDCYSITGTSPTIIGRAQNPASCFHNIGGNVADGDTVVLDQGGANRTYEFDTNSSVSPGNVPIPLTAVDNVTAAQAIAAAVNGDPLSPIRAQAVPIGMTEQYVAYAFKTDTGYGATNANPVDANGTIGTPGTFNYNGFGFNWLLISGTGLNAIPNNSTTAVKLVKSDDPGVTRNCTVVYRPADGLSLGVKVSLMQTTSFAGVPNGVYDVVVELAGCDTRTLPQAVTVVDNMLYDPTFICGSLGNTITLIWQAQNFQLPVHWLNNNLPDPNPTNPSGAGYEAVRKGNLFFPLMPDNSVQVPRQYPFPTAGNRTNNVGDNDWGSLRWPMVAGRRQMWQIIETNLPEDTFGTISGLWAGGVTAPGTLTYGIELREDDENGAVISQTTPAMVTDRFDWYEFAQPVILQGGPQTIAVVIYGDNSDAVDAGLSVDDLLLRVGAAFWPDEDADGDVDTTDFAAFQLCISGPGGGPLDESCAVFDRDADDDIDAADFTEFLNCTTGPDVPLTPASLPGGCSL